MEAINRFFIEDGHLDSIKNFNDNDSGKDKIIYEVMRVIEGKALFLREHLQRMEKSFKLMGKNFSYEYEKIGEYVEKVILANDKKDGNLKITFNIDKDEMKVFYIKHSYPTNDMYRDGVKTILYHGERKNTNAKIIDSDFRAKVNKKIKNENAFEAILIDKNGFITEGSKSNIFLIKGDKLVTSKVEEVLPGVTRSKIIKKCKESGIKFEESNIKYNDLEEFDAMFISGTSPGILPISQVDNIPMDVKNKLMRRIIELYNEYI